MNTSLDTITLGASKPTTTPARNTPESAKPMEAAPPVTAERQATRGFPPTDQPAPGVDQTVAILNQISLQRSLKLEFSIHENSGRVVVRVIDRSTDEVVRQFPPEELLSLAERFHNGGRLLEDLVG